MKLQLCWLVAGIMAWGLSGCGPQMRNFPVARGQTSLSASVGGPMVRVYSRSIPVPYALLGATYGLTDRVNLYADLHVMAAVFRFAGMTPGIVWFPRFSVSRLQPSIAAQALTFSDFEQTRSFPELITSLSYPLSDKWSAYSGVRHTFQTTARPSHIPSLFGGMSCRMGRARVTFELQWLAMNLSNQYTLVEYEGVEGHGAIAPQVGLAVDMGRVIP